MASIRREMLITAHPEEVWDAVRDVGAVHTRLAPGFVVDTRLERGARVVTFGNGLVVRELIVDIDDKARRLVWAAVGGRLSHHNASLQVRADDGGRSRVTWIADLLPDELAGYVAGLIEQGMTVMKKTLEVPDRVEPCRTPS
jgi:carbon monoxide dehydrogenase subunit G